MILDVKGIIFDMDGTLTRPIINFHQIRREIGIDTPTDIVDAIAAMPGKDRARAWRIIRQHEDHANRHAVVQPGVRDLLHTCKASRLRLAILTRNTERSALELCKNYSMHFDPIITRDYPHMKPSPLPVFHICEQWQLPPKQVLVVGDYLHDIQAGRAAGALTCFLKNIGAQDFSHESDYEVNSAFELKQLLKLRYPRPVRR